MLSGTSRDGVDAVLVEFDGQQPRVIASLCVAYPAALAVRLRHMIERHLRPGDDEMQLADQELAEFFALSAWSLLDDAGVKAKDVTALGSHGQTVWHKPVKPRPETIQLGDPQHIANLTGIPTVARFRQADLAAGGQGAPLAPLLHGALFRPGKGVCVVLNLGGIANISVLDHEGNISGYDTGPANCLLDSWIRKHKGTDFDDGGQWAAGGSVDGKLLDLLLADPYFALQAPKSTGVEYFNYRWLRSRLDGRQPDPDRLAQEIAYLAERLDVTEEVVRLGTHLAAARELLAADAPAGRRLGFLAQEMLREINTIGSKANDAAIAAAVIGMKEELERFREQLENIE